MRQAHGSMPGVLILAAICSCGGESTVPFGAGGTTGIAPAGSGSAAPLPPMDAGVSAPGAGAGAGRAGDVAVLSSAGASGSRPLKPGEIESRPDAGQPADNWTSFGGGNDNNFSRPQAVFDVSSMEKGPGMAWNIAAPGVTGTPAIYDGVAYWWDIGTANEGTFHATKIADGSDFWPPRKYKRGSTASPFVDAARVYMGDRDTTVRALNRMTGELAWEKKVSENINGQLWSSPIVVDGVLIIGMAGKGTGSGVGATVEKLRNFGGAVIGLNATTGEKIWHFETTLAPDGTKYGPGAPVWSSPAVDAVRKHIYIGTGNSYYPQASKYSDSLLALDYSTTDPKGKLVWSRQFTANDNYTQMSPSGPDADVGAAPTIFSVGGKDYVGVGDKSGRFFVLERDLKPDAAKGGENTLVWWLKLSEGGATGGVMAPAAYRDGVLYVASNDAGRRTLLYALDALTGKPKWGPMAQPFITYGNIILTKDALLLGTSTGYATPSPPANVLAYRLDNGQAYPWKFRLSQQHGGGMSISNGTLLVGYGFHFLNDAQEPVMGGLIALRAGGAMGPIGGSEAPPTPTGAATFKAVYDEVLGLQCSAVACHGTTGLSIDDPATAYAKLLAATAKGPGCNNQKLVEPGKPDQSLLIQKLRPNPPCGGQMPPGGSLRPEDLDQLVKWIQMGARND